MESLGAMLNELKLTFTHNKTHAETQHRQGDVPNPYISEGMNDLLIGGNFSINSTTGVFEQASAALSNVIQIFLSDHKSWPNVPIHEDFVTQFRHDMQTSNWSKEQIFVHANLFINLASVDHGVTQRSRKVLMEELSLCETLGLKYYIIHPGSSKRKLSRDAAIKKFTDTINEALTNTRNIVILIENMAGQGDTLGSNFGELKSILQVINQKDRIGFCLDTQHLWASGHDLCNWDTILKDFDDTIGREHLRVIHFNDSKSCFNSKIDSHEKIGKGTIPMKGLRAIINDPNLRGIPKILETSHSEDPLNITSTLEEITTIRRDILHKKECHTKLKPLEDAEVARHQLLMSCEDNRSTHRGPCKRTLDGNEKVDNVRQHYSVINEKVLSLYNSTPSNIPGAIKLHSELERMHLFSGRNRRIYARAVIKKEAAMKRLGERMKGKWKLAFQEADNGSRRKLVDAMDGIKKKNTAASKVQEELRMEYYTPTIVVDHIHKFWPNGIDLDPASSPIANHCVGASRIFTKEDNEYTFEASWKAKTLYLNPPFEQPIGTRSVDKFIKEWRAGHIEEALLLLPTSGGQWMQEAFNEASALIIPKHRLRFWNSSKNGLSPRYQTNLLYFGKNVDSVQTNFKEHFHCFSAPNSTSEGKNVTSFLHSAQTEENKHNFPFLPLEEDDVNEEPYWDTISAQMNLTIENREAIAILDSGACNTTISTNLWRRILERKRFALRRWRWGGIKVANDQEVYPIGWTNLTISVGPSKVSLPVSVQDNLPVDMLVGTDWLRHSKAVVDWEDESLTFKEYGGKVRIRITARRSQMKHLKAFMQDTVVIPAFEQKLCTLRTEETGHTNNNKYYYMHPREKLTDKGVLVAAGYNTVNNNTCNIMIGNPTKVPMRIKKDVIIAELEPCPNVLPHQFLSCEPEIDNETPKGTATAQPIEEIASEVTELMLAMNIKGDKYTKEEFVAVTELITKHRKTFSDTPGLCHLIQHRINTGDKDPILCQPYRVPFKLKPVIKEIIEDMLKNKIIRKSSSPWAFPVVMVPKPDGKWRFTVDYRKLNAIVPRDAYPLPRIDDHLTALGDSKIFTVFDLVSGFWQIGVNEEDKHKTAFICSEGLYEYERMPMGLSNSPATFQRLMQQIIPADIRMKYALVYLDDIIIHSKSFLEHIEHLDDILTRVGAANLKIKPKKVAFAQNTVKYLGHLVTSEGVRPDPSRVESIEKWAIPTNLKDLRSFVQLVNYYRNYIRNFAQIAAPLYDLMKKDAEYTMGDQEIEAFNKLRVALLSDDILKRPDWDLPFVLQTDASIKGLGVVLAQKEKDGRERVIGYASRSLSPEEKPWGTHEWEALALIWGAEYFRNYLYAQHFVVESDNLDLTWLRNSTKGGRLLRWGLRLSEFDFTIKHRKGSQNGNADALSRHPLGEERNEEPINAKLKATAKFHEDIPGLAEDSSSFAQLNATGLETQEVLNEWLQAQQECPEIGCIGKLLRGEIEEPKNEVSIERRRWIKLTRLAKNMFIRPDGLIGSKCILAGGIRGQKVYETIAVPIKKRETILMSLHGRAHLGINKTLRLIKERYYWKHLQSDVKAFIKGCLMCRSRKDPRPSLSGKLQPFLHLNNRPWDTLTMDIYGPLPRTKDGNIAKVILNEFLPRHSIPRKVVTDNDISLISDSLNLMWKLLGTRKLKASISHPQTNTAAERFNRFLGDSIYAAVGSKQTDWDLKLGTILMAYRMSINPTTGESPYFLLHGTDPVLPEDVIFALEPKKDMSNKFLLDKFRLMREIFKRTKERLTEFAEKEKLTGDRKRLDVKDYPIGLRVMVFHEETHTKDESTKLHSRYSGPYRISEVITPGKCYKVWHPQTGNEWTVNVDRLRAFDPWESYHQGRAEADKEFWNAWSSTADNANLPVGNAITPKTFSKEMALQEEEEERRSNLERYHHVIQSHMDAKPTAEGSVEYAQNWAGEWIPYDSEDQDYEVIRILDRRRTTPGSWEWLIQWKGDWLPTWEGLDTFKEGKTTGLTLVWQQFENSHPYARGDKAPTIVGLRNRKR